MCVVHIHAPLGIRIIYAMLDLVCALNSSVLARMLFGRLFQPGTLQIILDSRNTSWQPSNVHHCLAPTVSSRLAFLWP